MLGLSLSSLKLNEFMPCVWHCLHILRQVVLEMHNDTKHSPNTMPSIVPALLHSASFSPWKKAVSLLLNCSKILSPHNVTNLFYHLNSRSPNFWARHASGQKVHHRLAQVMAPSRNFQVAKKRPAWWAWTAWLRNQSGNTKICVISKFRGNI